MIVSRLAELLPAAGFITEEETENNFNTNQTWIVDPLDGTTNFLYKIPHFSISIALKEGENISLGIVHEVMQGISYTAIRGQGAWANGKVIHVSKTKELSKAMIGMGFPYDRTFDLEANLNMLRFAILNGRGIRRMGSAALDLAYVAAGKLDIYYEHTLNIWDLAAGVLLVEEAGGHVSDYDGSSAYLSTGAIVSTNGILHQVISEAVQKFYSISYSE